MNQFIGWIRPLRARTVDAAPSDRAPAGIARPSGWWVQPLLVMSLAALAQLVSVELWLPGPRMHMLWLPGALLLCTLLATPARRAWMPMLAVCLGVAAVLVPLGLPLLHSLALVAAQCLLVWPVAALLRLPLAGAPPLQRPRWVLRFVLLAVFVLPLLAAGLSALASPWLGLSPWLGHWSNIALSHAASYALLVPPFVSIAHPGMGGVSRPGVRQLLGIIALAGMFLLTCWFPLGDPFITQPVLLLMSFCVMVYLLLAFGAPSAFIALLLLSLACMQISVAHGFPPPLGAGRTSVLAIQVWTIALALALLALVVIAEQRRSLRVSLQAAYERLAELTGRMLLVQEEERARIARELHDDINQSLAAISIQLSGLRRELGGPQRQKVCSLHAQLLQVSGSVRQISHDLHPSILRFTSLASALESLCESHNGRQLCVRCNAQVDAVLDEDQKLNLFRIAQEALHNVQEHAGARSSTVHLLTESGEVVMRVEDDGVGIPDSVLKGYGGGLGMVTMEERARLIDGQLALYRPAGGGSVVEVRIAARGAVRPLREVPGTQVRQGRAS
jgi:two-component system sensor histidine kinase UhpB